jgi:hypothetical protein
MIVTAISAEIDKYYSLDKKTIVKNILDPVTKKYSVEYVQFIYNKVGKPIPIKEVGTTIDKYA